MQEKTNLAAKMAKISGELGAIPKTRPPGSTVSYAFRSIDDVMNALNPLLSREGIIVLSKVIDRKLIPVTSKSGTMGYLADVIYELTFDDGTETKSTQEWSIAVDYGDKSATQAMSMAYKYALIRVFVVTTKDLIANDADNRAVEMPEQPTENQLKEVFMSELKKAGIYDTFVKLTKKVMGEKFNEWLHMKPELKSEYITELKNQLTKQV